MPAKKTKKTNRQETRHCTAKTVDEPPHEKSQGICAFDVETEGPPDMTNSAKSEMNGIIHRQEITVEPSNEGVRVGNSAGLAVGRQLDQMNSNMTRILSRNEQIETQTRQLEERVAFLEATSHDFSSARSRYLSFAKRDVFGTSNEEDERIIKTGNRIVHSGNARADAGLYDRNVRRDFTTYIRLYGVHPGTVNAIDYQPTIDALNRHASATTEHPNNLNPEFRQAFDVFIAALEASDYTGGYKDGNPTAVTAAYWNFLRTPKVAVT